MPIQQLPPIFFLTCQMQWKCNNRICDNNPLGSHQRHYLWSLCYVCIHHFTPRIRTFFYPPFCFNFKGKWYVNLCLTSADVKQKSASSRHHHKTTKFILIRIINVLFFVCLLVCLSVLSTTTTTKVLLSFTLSLIICSCVSLLLSIVELCTASLLAMVMLLMMMTTTTMVMMTIRSGGEAAAQRATPRLRLSLGPHLSQPKADHCGDACCRWWWW